MFGCNLEFFHCFMKRDGWWSSFSWWLGVIEREILYSLIVISFLNNDQRALRCVCIDESSNLGNARCFVLFFKP